MMRKVVHTVLDITYEGLVIERETYNLVDKWMETFTVKGGGDNTGLMSAINELRNAVNALANKPAPAMAIQVGAEKLGEVVGRQAETGTNQYKNAYRLA